MNAKATLKNSNEPFLYQQFYKNFYECFCQKNDSNADNSKTQKSALSNTLSNINQNGIINFITEIWV
jgi:hypothetical protein